jgi:hypothetical protein
MSVREKELEKTRQNLAREFMAEKESMLREQVAMYEKMKEEHWQEQQRAAGMLEAIERRENELKHASEVEKKRREELIALMEKITVSWTLLNIN